jgi:hypothetical protein
MIVWLIFQAIQQPVSAAATARHVRAGHVGATAIAAAIHLVQCTFFVSLLSADRYFPLFRQAPRATI